jgi:hypothetical protein
MKRLIAVGVGLIWGGAVLAGEPATARTLTAPAATLRPSAATDVTRPLPAAVSAALPPPTAIAPEVVAGHPAPYVPTECPGGGCARDARTCREKLIGWLTYRPGPRVLPLLTPVPYQPPLRHYFPCRPGDCLVVGGCHPTAGCAPTPGSHGFIAPVPATAPPVTLPVTPVGSVGAPYSTDAMPARVSVRDRVMNLFSIRGFASQSSDWSDPTPYVDYPMPVGPSAAPPPGGFRFAAPSWNPAAAAPRTGPIQAGHQQPPVTRPISHNP